MPLLPAFSKANDVFTDFLFCLWQVHNLWIIQPDQNFVLVWLYIHRDYTAIQKTLGWNDGLREWDCKVNFYQVHQSQFLAWLYSHLINIHHKSYFLNPSFQQILTWFVDMTYNHYPRDIYWHLHDAWSLFTNILSTITTSKDFPINPGHILLLCALGTNSFAIIVQGVG